MAQFLISTTGTASPVVINDLGARSFLHPATSNFDLSEEYTLEEIRDSEDLRAAIVAGELTATLDTVAITDGATFDAAMEDFNVERIETIEGNVSTLQSQVSALQSGGRRFTKVIAVATSTAVPPTEVNGDRYLIDYSGAPNAAWDGVPQGQIAEFNGTIWEAAGMGQEGDVVYVDDINQDVAIVDDGSPALEFRNGLLEQSATQVPYTPTTPADWTVTPTEVGGGLDEIADRVTDLEAAPATSKKTYTFSAGDNGNISGDKDLERTGRPTTNLSPFIVPITGTLWAITIASKQGTNETFDIQIIVNGSVVHTENIVSADKGFNNGLSLAVTAGDEVRLRFIIGTSGSVKDVGAEVYGIEA